MWDDGTSMSPAKLYLRLSFGFTSARVTLFMDYAHEHKTDVTQSYLAEEQTFLQQQLHKRRTAIDERFKEALAHLLVYSLPPMRNAGHRSHS
jgi:hypothetical protein